MANPKKPELTLNADDRNIHSRFGRDIPPVATVSSGTVIEIFTREASDRQLGPDSTLADLGAADMSRVHPLTGPIAVEGAEVGDVLVVELYEVEVGDWGWIAIPPGMGVLADEMPPKLRTFKIEPGAEELRFAEDIVLPIRPFPGILGVAPDSREQLSTMPPRAGGGNMDINTLTAGATVRLPVLVEGANFSIGDGHAMQGDGEVCGTALEVPLRVVLELRVEKSYRPLPGPRYETAKVFGVTAFDTSLDGATKKATRAMVDHLAEDHGLTETEAYMLCSLAADLKISEAVNLPHVLVCMELPKSVFRR